MQALILQIAAHCLVGCALAAATWAVGIATIAVGVRPELRRTMIARYGYAVGLFLVMSLAYVAAVSRAVGVAAIAVVLSSSALALRRYGSKDWWPRLQHSAAAIAFAFALALFFGFKWHGPTETVPAGSQGELLFWVARAAAATRSIVPFNDLSVEGEKLTLLESAPAVLAAALPGIDVTLFHAVSLPAFLACALVIGFASSGLRTTHPPLMILLLGLLAAGAMSNTGYVVESPAANLALPLAFSVYGLLADEESPPLWYAAIAGMVGAAFLATKVLPLVGVAVAVTAALVLRARFSGDSRQLVLVAAVAAAVGAAGAYEFLQTASWFVREFPLIFLPKSLIGQLANPTAHDVGAVFLLVAEVAVAALLILRREWPLAAAFSLTVAVRWTVVPPGVALQTTSTFLMLVVALVALRWAPLSAAEKALLTIGSAFASASMMLQGYLQPRTGIIFAAVVIPLFVTAVAVSRPRVELRQRPIIEVGVAGICATIVGMSGRPVLAVLLGACCYAAITLVRTASIVRRGFAIAALCVLAAATAGIAARAVAYRDFRLEASGVALTSDDRSLWKYVAAHVPKDALIFVDADPWALVAYYAATGQRQLYFGAAAYAPLSLDASEIARRTTANEEVLAGIRSPTSVPLARSYSAFFGAVGRGKTVPSRAKVVYVNTKWILFALAA